MLGPISEVQNPLYKIITAPCIVIEVDMQYITGLFLLNTGLVKNSVSVFIYFHFFCE